MQRISTKRTITPFLWFDDNAEEAMNFYVSTFKNSKVISGNHYGEAGPGEKDSVMTVTFELDGQRFIALNGGPVPEFTFSPAISFLVSCETQQEVDDLWERLSEGGQKRQCGWLSDKYGLTWQIVPSVLGDLLGDEDDEKANRVMQAMRQMTKLDIAILQKAYDGR